MKNLTTVLFALAFLSCVGAARATAPTFNGNVIPAGAPYFDVRFYGAKCDGSTNDSSAFSAAESAAQAAGGTVIVPATGHACVLNSGIALGNGVGLWGLVPLENFQGSTATIAQWAQYGSWIQCADTVNPCVKLTGHGSSVGNLNFIHSQPIPGGVAYTPTTYPCTVYDQADFSTVQRIVDIAGTDGICLDYPLASGGGTGVVMRDLLLSDFNVGMTFNGVNDDIAVDNVWVRNMYYSSNGYVVQYLENNLIGLDIHYLDNPTIHGFECLYCYKAMMFTDDTVLGNTHSLYNAHVSAIDCDLDRICMAVASNTTTVLANFSDVIAQQDVGNALADNFFQFGSDNVNVRFTTLGIPATLGGQIMSIGNGTGGLVQISNARVSGYSSVSAGQSGFVLNAGSQLILGPHTITKTAGAGSLFAGANAYNGLIAQTFTWSPFSKASEMSVTGTGTSSFVGFTTNNQAVVSQLGAIQGRIIGSVNVTTPQAAGTGTIRLGNFPEVTASFSCAASGIVTFDSGWIDISSSTATGVGIVNIASTSGCVEANGDLTVEFR